MRHGWNKHIPLDHLTLQFAQREYSNPSGDQSYLMTAADGSIISSEKTYSKDKELLLPYNDWSAAYRRLLELIEQCYPGSDVKRVYKSFKMHYERIRDDPAAQDPAAWPVYVAYDVRLRCFFENLGKLPGKWQSAVFQSIQAQFLLGTRDRNHSPPTKRARLDNKVSSDTGRVFCFLCGLCTHSARSCNNDKPFLVQNQKGEWVAPGNKPVCYKWNSLANSCDKCGRAHICTLCGKADHAARNCKRSSL